MVVNKLTSQKNIPSQHVQRTATTTTTATTTATATATKSSSMHTIERSNTNTTINQTQALNGMTPWSPTEDGQRQRGKAPWSPQNLGIAFAFQV
jgi:Tfp pilus assembly major pilin PilA